LFVVYYDTPLFTAGKDACIEFFNKPGILCCDS